MNKPFELKLCEECNGTGLVRRLAISRGRFYTVIGWYLDSNGCLKTYGTGYQESFMDETKYI